MQNWAWNEIELWYRDQKGASRACHDEFLHHSGWATLLYAYDGATCLLQDLDVDQHISFHLM